MLNVPDTPLLHRRKITALNQHRDPPPSNTQIPRPIRLQPTAHATFRNHHLFTSFPVPKGTQKPPARRTRTSATASLSTSKPSQYLFRSSPIHNTTNMKSPPFSDYTCI